MQFTRNSLREASGSTKMLPSPLPLLDELPLRGVVFTELRDEGLKKRKTFYQELYGYFWYT